MYKLELVEQLKLRTTPSPDVSQVATVNPAVWKLGWTSLLTDISSEMVNSALPAFIVLYLHAGPLAFGAIDGLYHGMAVALLGIVGGILADRRRRYKEVAAVGYGLSALCKLGMVAAGASMGWLAAIVTVDRAGKGIRTAPRDALLSLTTNREGLTMAFAIHRAMDAAGTLIGPLIAFALLSLLPHAYDVLWLTSFAFALVGFAVLWLFVDNPPGQRQGPQAGLRDFLGLVRSPGRFRLLVLAAAGLALFTVSDGFVYLLLQSRNGAAPQYFPLYYMVTASSYMLLSIPAGLLAKRMGRRNVFLASQGILLLTYLWIWSGVAGQDTIPWAPLLLFGLYYAGSEGVLMAIASSLLNEPQRTSGLALLNTFIGFARMAGSLGFGWLWHAYGSNLALGMFGVGLGLAVITTVTFASRWSDVEG
jgi:MFS family permease